MIEQMNGPGIALTGLAVVFGGLIVMALTVGGLALVLRRRKNGPAVPMARPSSVPLKKTSTKEIPEDHLVALSAAIECYRRIHFDRLQSELTFKHGSAHSTWKTAYKYLNLQQQRPRKK